MHYHTVLYCTLYGTLFEVESSLLLGVVRGLAVRTYGIIKKYNLVAWGEKRKAKVFLFVALLPPPWCCFVTKTAVGNGATPGGKMGPQLAS